MKKARFLPVLLLSLVMTVSCSDKGIELSLEDPQDIVFINDHIDKKLIEAFGEENIHFGHTPPILEGISFLVDGMYFDTCIRYLFNPDDPNAPILVGNPPSAGDHERTKYYHHFYNQHENISSHKLRTIDPSNNQFTRKNDAVFIIGNSLSFTAYYEEEIQEDGSGHPTNGILISGTLEYQDTLFVGVRNYKIGKMILSYKEPPLIQSYAQGTIEVKTHPGLSYANEWDQ